MRVHLVHAHPEPQSFVAAMETVTRQTLRKQGHRVTRSDLYAMGFNAVASAADFRSPANPDRLVYALEQRQAAQAGTLASDIAREVERVLAADLLAFTFPVFWFGTPAILKGWIERIFLSGLFYGGRRLYGRGGLAGKRAFVACSLGGRAQMFGPGAIHGELEGGMMRHFFQGTLGYVGLAVHRPFVAYHVPYLDEATRGGILEDLAACVDTLDARPFLPMPDLADYDDRLAPRHDP
ncbi:MAG TPA: flavodoxin family protein [Kiloniellaceae bacterium]|nr:flavodoxin family protein [Kiloniellaceae bacterium]HIP79618.1 flavodoxin family protein [Kiloniellaceae bacterium]